MRRGFQAPALGFSPGFAGARSLSAGAELVLLTLTPGGPPILLGPKAVDCPGTLPKPGPEPTLFNPGPEAAGCLAEPGSGGVTEAVLFADHFRVGAGAAVGDRAPAGAVG